MDETKYARTMEMLCPVCASSLFDHDPDVDLVRCVNCGREIAKDDLIDENRAMALSELKEIGDEIASDAMKKLKASFKNSKIIKFK